jgi:hypothetical protein
VAGAAAAAAPAQPVPAPAPVQPVAAPPKSGSNALKIVLIILAVFFGLVLLVVGTFGYFAWRVAHAVKVAEANKQISIPVPGGSFSASTSQTFTAADLGVDIYPGAQSTKAGGRVALFGNTTVTAVYVTSDSKDQVVSFYKDKCGSDASIMDTPNGAIITVKKGEQESVMVTITANSREYSGKTQIAIVHITSPKPS